jgi:hypothetical protein
MALWIYGLEWFFDYLLDGLKGFIERDVISSPTLIWFHWFR